MAINIQGMQDLIELTILSLTPVVESTQQQFGVHSPRPKAVKVASMISQKAAQAALKSSIKKVRKQHQRQASKSCASGIKDLTKAQR